MNSAYRYFFSVSHEEDVSCFKIRYSWLVRSVGTIDTSSKDCVSKPFMRLTCDAVNKECYMKYCVLLFPTELIQRIKRHGRSEIIEETALRQEWKKTHKI
jgi:hypothetical protein